MTDRSTRAGSATCRSSPTRPPPSNGSAAPPAPPPPEAPAAPAAAKSPRNTTPRASCSSPSSTPNWRPVPPLAAARAEPGRWGRRSTPRRRRRSRPTGVGYARCSTAHQELQSQLDALHEVGCDPIFSEKISTRIKVRPEFTKAIDLARTIKNAVPHQPVSQAHLPLRPLPTSVSGPRGVASSSTVSRWFYIRCSAISAFQLRRCR
jgi:hypothetical protein